MDALLARADELARRWAIALIVTLPLERIGEISLQSFAREAPALCAQVVRALESDAELERMAAPVRSGGGAEPAPARRLRELAAARDGPAAVEAVEALRGVLWEALLDELRSPSFEQSPARRVGDLADRLAFVCSMALGSTLATAPLVTLVAPPEADVHITAARARPATVESPPVAPPRRPPGVDERLAEARGSVQAREERTAWKREERLGRAAGGQAPPRAYDAAARLSRRSDIGGGVVIVDEGAAPDARPSAQAPVGAAAPRGRALPWDIPLSSDAEESG